MLFALYSEPKRKKKKEDWDTNENVILKNKQTEC